MNIISKQAKKFISLQSPKNREKLHRAIDGLTDMAGNISKLSGNNLKITRYRLKLEHYRVIFEKDTTSDAINVLTVNTKTNMKFRKYGYFCGT